MSETTSIILAAINSVGPKKDIDPKKGSYEDQVARAAEDVVVLTNPEGKIAKRLEEFKGTRPFIAVVSAVGIEETSTRGFIGLASKTEGKNKGVDTLRTERTDSDVSAMAMVEELSKLKGHRVLIYKRMDSSADGTTKYRILHRYEDLGKAPKPMIDEILENLKAAHSLVAEKADIIS